MNEIFYYIIISLGLFICICAPIFVFCCDLCTKQNDANNDINNVQFEKKPLLITNL